MVSVSFKIHLYNMMYVFICGLIILLCAIYLDGLPGNEPLDVMFKHHNIPGVTSCYDAEASDDIPSIEGRKFPDDSIFFIETTCKGGLTLKQACSVEAAARAHPDRDINVLFVGPVTSRSLSKSPIWRILNYHNINLFRVHITEYLKNTPVKSFLSSGNLVKFNFLLAHLSDILKFLTLFKYGGIYLDLDVMVVKSFDFLPRKKNWAARHDIQTVSTNVISAARQGIGHKIMYAVLKSVENNFSYNKWRHNSSHIFTKILQKTCRVNKIENMKPKQCKGFVVYGPSYFFPIQNRGWKYMFAYAFGKIPTEPYVYYNWEAMTPQNATLDDEPLFRHLTRSYCPVTFGSKKKND